MSAAERDRSRSFSELLRSLRGSIDQTTFGTRFGGYSASAISAFENGTRTPTRRLINPLVQAYPEFEDEIEKTFEALLDDAHDAATPASAGSLSPVLRYVQSLLISNDPTRASAKIREVLAAGVDEPAVRVRLLELDARTSEALEEATAAGLSQKALELRQKLAGELTASWKYDEALDLIDSELNGRRESGGLWLQRGTVQWHQEYFAGAYASLATALELGSPRPVVALIRAQVLCEWGRLEDGIQELQGVLPMARDPVATAEARSTLAYALSRAGDSARALEQLELAIKFDPRNALIRYHEVLCHEAQGRSEEMRAALEACINARPPTNLSELKFRNLIYLVWSEEKAALESTLHEGRPDNEREFIDLYGALKEALPAGQFKLKVGDLLRERQAFSLIIRVKIQDELAENEAGPPET